MEKGFVDVCKVIDDVILEIRYSSAYNFIGDKIDGYVDPVAILTIEACEALKKVSVELKSMGYRLKIYDAYRPMKAVRHFVRWAKDIDDVRMKDIFYPDVDKKDLFRLGFISDRSSHSRGSTLDVTLFDDKLGKEVDMGSNFDYFGDISHSDYIGELSNEQLNNRKLLIDVMSKYGFKVLDSEWWHFTLVDEPYKDTYFEFEVRV